MREQPSHTLMLSPIEEVIEDYRAGKQVIIVDHVERENEGDLAVATEKLTPEAVNFMAQEGRGLICVSISIETAQKLNLPLQVLNNNSPFQTPFAVSIDHRDIVGQGVTASARCHTMTSLVSDNSVESDFVSPGHVFPLIAHPSGVLGRQGQTEGSYDLARIAGLKASGVICEILNSDGTMARGEQIIRFATKHNIKITSVEEIIRYRINREVRVREIDLGESETEYGKFAVSKFIDDVDGKEHLVLTYGNIRCGTPLVRIHSECLTGDVFGSRRCDCGEQLSQALKQIVASGSGVLLYLRQEGRGIGLLNKLKAYELQDNGADTVEANIKLGFAPDERDFAIAAKVLNSKGIKQIRILTNNPEKINTLTAYGIEIAARVPVKIEPDQYSKRYLETKRDKMGHIL